MKIQNKVALCLLPLAFSAEASENLNFATVKFGLDVPSITKNQASVKSVDNSFIAGLELGRFVTDNIAVSVEYNYVNENKFKFDDVDSFTKRGFKQKESYDWSVKSSDVFLANVAYTFAKLGNLSPYFKVGAGAARNKVGDYSVTTSYTQSNGATGSDKITYSGGTKTNFAWRVGAGVNVECTDLIDIDLAYALTSRGKVTLNSTSATGAGGVAKAISQKSVSLLDHAVLAGVKFKF